MTDKDLNEIIPLPDGRRWAKDGDHWYRAERSDGEWVSVSDTGYIVAWSKVRYVEDLRERALSEVRAALEEVAAFVGIDWWQRGGKETP